MTRRAAWWLSLALAAFALAGARPAPAPAPDYREQVHVGVNALRQKRDLPPLAGRDDLHRYAMSYAQELAARGVLSHYDAQGRALDARLNDAGLTDWHKAGENLARGTAEGFSVDDIVKCWNLSPGHYQNIVTPEFRYTGIGWAKDAKGENVYIVQIFMH